MEFERIQSNYPVDPRVPEGRVLWYGAVSSDDGLVGYSETTQLTVFTPLVSFLVVLISFLSLLALVAFFTDDTAGQLHAPAYVIASVRDPIRISEEKK